ncbi:LIMS1 [Branchiostoma lanceolatum]|uniref:LIMS1 protein n=1 Tax=Branchiostoma lanceolatum TaxID=7740 RepID=A0A8K0EEF5_BRALA|nr:LIMS1 [Branchiostoma lanceolatum]
MSPPPQKRQEKAPAATQEEPKKIPMEMPTPPPRHKKDLPVPNDNEEPVKAESPPPQKEEEKEPEPVQEQVVPEPVKTLPPQPQEKEEPPKPEEKEDVTPVAVEPVAPQPEEVKKEPEQIQPEPETPTPSQPEEKEEPPKPEEKEDVTPVAVEPAAPQPEEVKKEPEQIQPEPETPTPSQPEEKEEPPKPEEKEDVTPVAVEPAAPQPEEVKKEPKQIQPEPVTPMPSQPPAKEEPSIPDKSEESKPETTEEPAPQKEETTEEEKEPDTTEAVIEEPPVETEPETPKEDKEKVADTVPEKPTEDEPKDEPKLEDQHISELPESVPAEIAPPLPPRRSKSKKDTAPADAVEPIVPEEQAAEENDNGPDRAEPPPLPVKKKSQRSQEELPSPVDEDKYPEISFSDEPPLQTNLDDIFSSPDAVLNAPCKGSDDDVPKEDEEGIVPDELAPVKPKKRSESFKAGRDRLKALGKSLKDKATRRKSEKAPDEDKPETTDGPDNLVEDAEIPTLLEEPNTQRPGSRDRLKALRKSLKEKATRRKSEKSSDEDKPEITEDPDNVVEDAEIPTLPEEPDTQKPGSRDRLKALGKSLKEKATRRKSDKSPDEDKPEITDDPENLDKDVDPPTSPQEPDTQKPGSRDRLKALGKSLKEKATRRKSAKTPDEDKPEITEDTDKPEITDDPESLVTDVDTPTSPQDPDSQKPGSRDRLKALGKSLKDKATRRKSAKTPDEDKPETIDDPDNLVQNVDTPSSPQEPESPKPKKESKSLLSKLKDGLLSDSEKELTPHVQKKQNDEEADEPVVSKAADPEDMATPGPSHQPDENIDDQDEAPIKPEKKKIHFPRKLSKLRNSFKKRAKSKSDEDPKSDLEGDATPARDDENKENAPSLEKTPDSPSALKTPTSPDQSFSTVIENFAAQEDPGPDDSDAEEEQTKEDDQGPDEAWSPWFKDTPKIQAPSDAQSSPVLDKKPENDVPSPLIEDPYVSPDDRPKLPPKEKKSTEPDEQSDKEEKEEEPIWEKIYDGKAKDKKEEPLPAPKDYRPPKIKPYIEDRTDGTPRKPSKDDKEIFNTCWVCGDAITGMMIVALGRYWHAEHFRCARCGIPFKAVGLPHYEHDGKAYCEPHFHELFSDFCYACDQPITDEIICAMNKTWCRKHFCCAMCNQSIKLEEKFYACDSRPVCKKCKEKVPASLLQTRKKRTIIDTIKDMVRSPRQPTTPTVPTSPESPPKNPNEYFV